MVHSLSRNYDTDLSRTEVRTILTTIARRLNDARGREIPTKMIFEEPEITDESQNRFEVAVRPTVTEAGFDPFDLVTTVNYNGKSVYVHGADLSGGRETLRVTVENGINQHECDIETQEKIWSEL